eukprot:Platyproteum_vivax@DN7297_c1_g1_i3.p1
MIRYILVIVGVLGCLAVRDRHGLSTANYKFPQTGIRTLRIRTGLKETPELLIDNLSDADLDFLKERLPRTYFHKVYDESKKRRTLEYKKDDIPVVDKLKEDITDDMAYMRISKDLTEEHLEMLEKVLQEHLKEDKDVVKGDMIYKMFKSSSFPTDVAVVPAGTDTLYFDCLTPRAIFLEKYPEMKHPEKFEPWMEWMTHPHAIRLEKTNNSNVLALYHPLVTDDLLAALVSSLKELTTTSGYSWETDPKIFGDYAVEVTGKDIVYFTNPEETTDEEQNADNVVYLEGNTFSFYADSSLPHHQYTHSEYPNMMPMTWTMKGLSKRAAEEYVRRATVAHLKYFWGSFAELSFEIVKPGGDPQINTQIEHSPAEGFFKRTVLVRPAWNFGELCQNMSDKFMSQRYDVIPSPIGESTIVIAIGYAMMGWQNQVQTTLGTSPHTDSKLKEMGMTHPEVHIENIISLNHFNDLDAETFHNSKVMEKVKKEALVQNYVSEEKPPILSTGMDKKTAPSLIRTQKKELKYWVGSIELKATPYSVEHDVAEELREKLKGEVKSLDIANRGEICRTINVELTKDNKIILKVSPKDETVAPAHTGYDKILKKFVSELGLTLEVATVYQSQFETHTVQARVSPHDAVKPVVPDEYPADKEEEEERSEEAIQTSPKGKKPAKPHEKQSEKVEVEVPPQVERGITADTVKPEDEKDKKKKKDKTGRSFSSICTIQ